VNAIPLFVRGIIWSAVLVKTVVHARYWQTCWNRNRTHTQRHQSELRQTVDAAEAAPRNRYIDMRLLKPSMRDDFDFQIDEIVDQMHTRPMKEMP
jgi:hypothetical protein